MQDILVTVKPAASRARLQVRPRGRRCAQEGCATILSIYNPTAYCYLHERSILKDVNQAQPRSDRAPLERRCRLATCGELFETSNPRRFYCSARCRMTAFTLRRRNEAGEGSADDAA